MESPKTSYTCKSRNTNLIWIFKYDLEGELRSFEILGNGLTPEQVVWIFNPDRFPYKETMISLWQKHLKKNFEIFKEEFELTFENFYNLFGNKVGKMESKRAWEKLSKKDKINAIIGIKHYDNYLKRNPKYSKTYPATYLNKRRWESDYKNL